MMGGDGDDARMPSELLRPYSSYNIYFTLERVRLIEERRRRGGRSRAPSPSPAVGRASSLPVRGAPSAGYESLELPPLPPRYESLGPALTSDWCVPGKHRNVKRRHSASHGLASFKEMASVIAESWKRVDPETKAYVETVADIQKEHYYKLKKQAKEKAKRGVRDDARNEAPLKNRMPISLDSGLAESEHSVRSAGSDRSRLFDPAGLVGSEHSFRSGGSGHSFPHFLTSTELVGSEHSPRLLTESEHSLRLGGSEHSLSDSIEGGGGREGFVAAARGLPFSFHASGATVNRPSSVAAAAALTASSYFSFPQQLLQRASRMPDLPQMGDHGQAAMMAPFYVNAANDSKTSSSHRGPSVPGPGATSNNEANFCHGASMPDRVPQQQDFVPGRTKVAGTCSSPSRHAHCSSLTLDRGSGGQPTNSRLMNHVPWQRVLVPGRSNTTDAPLSPSRDVRSTPSSLYRGPGGPAANDPFVEHAPRQQGFMPGRKIAADACPSPSRHAGQARTRRCGDPLDRILLGRGGGGDAACGARFEEADVSDEDIIEALRSAD